MLQITPHHRLLLAVKYVDFRKGIDSLAALCRQALEEDPFSGTVFVFTNRPRTSVKILVYDGLGFWLCQKRFSRGRLAWWPSKQEASRFSVKPSQLHILLSQGNPLDTPIPSDWRSVSPSSSSRRLP
jgi:transposase